MLWSQLAITLTNFLNGSKVLEIRQGTRDPIKIRFTDQ